MKIHLILAAAETDPLKKIEPFMPLVFPILASSAPNHQYYFTDLLSQDYNTIDFDMDCDLVGISFRVSATETAFKIADTYRGKGKKVVLGGPQASCIPFKAKEHADAVAVGEAETLWPILLNDLENKKLKSFYIAAPKKYIDLESFENYYYTDVPDLETLPFTKRQLFKRSYTFDMVFAARGCPINCSFCAVSKIFGTKTRLKPVDTVVEEINSCGKRFFLIDDTVFGRKDTYDYYLDLYKKITVLPLKRFWKGQANLDAITDKKGRKVVEAASLSGLAYIAVGFESLNTIDLSDIAHLNKMGANKDDTYLETLSKHISFIQNQGIGISAWFTMGLAHDTFNTINDAIDFCCTHHIFPVLNPIQALEGTAFYTDMKEKDLLFDNKKHVSNVKLSSLKETEYIKLMALSVKKAYSLTSIIKNTWFYFNKNRKLKRSVYSCVYKTIFIFLTQLRLKGVIKKEIIRFGSRIKE